MPHHFLVWPFARRAAADRAAVETKRTVVRQVQLRQLAGRQLRQHKRLARREEWDSRTVGGAALASPQRSRHGRADGQDDDRAGEDALGEERRRRQRRKTAEDGQHGALGAGGKEQLPGLRSNSKPPPGAVARRLLSAAANSDTPYIDIPVRQQQRQRVRTTGIPGGTKSLPALGRELRQQGGNHREGCAEAGMTVAGGEACRPSSAAEAAVRAEAVSQWLSA